MGSTTDAVRISLLGPLAVSIDDEDRPVSGPIRRRLLAVLAHRPGEVLSVDLLCELVWDGSPPATAESTLRMHISHLRQVLGNPRLIEQVPPGYRLDVAPEDIDLVRFEEHLRTGRIALQHGDLEQATEHLRAAKGLWRGLPDLPAAASSDVERLFSQRSELGVDLAELQMRLDGAHVDTSELSALTVERPFDERVWGLLITAQYWSGRQSDALETYRRAAQALDEELGIEPTADLRRLQQQILHHDPALAPPSSGQVHLPAFATTFVGRTAQITQIASLLHQHRLVTLTGLGGVGKTRMGVAAAEHVATRFTHGVTFIGLADHDDPAIIPALAARALDLVATTSAELGTALENKELLLVLDNCEHLVAAVAEMVSTLLARCRRLRILTTSRVPLNVVGECVWITPHLDTTDDEEQPAEAVRLFLDRARQARPGATLPEPDDPLLREATALLGGIPLAIELTAAQCGALTVADVVNQLRHTMRTSGSEHDRPARHQSMEAALHGTLQHLTPTAQLLFGRLGVFRSAAGIEAIQEVCTDDAVAASAVPGSLTELVQAAAVVADLSAEVGRYRLLPPVRAATIEVRARMVDDRFDLEAHHLAHYAHRAQTESQALNGPDQKAALERLDEIVADLRAALAHAVRRDPAQGLIMAASLSPYWLHRRMNAEGRRWISQLLEVGDDVESVVRATALRAAGGLAWDGGDHDDAQHLLHQARQIWISLGDKTGLALTLNNLAGVASDRGEHAAALEMWGEAHALFVESGHQMGAAASEFNRGIAAHKLGRLTDATTHLEAARAAFRVTGSRQTEAMTIERLATVHAQRGEHAVAMTLIRSVQAIYDDEGTPEQQARILWQRALRHRDLRQHSEATALVRAAAQAVLTDELLNAWWVSGLIETAAALRAHERPAHAAGLLGVARRHRERSGHGADPTTVPDLPEVIDHLHQVIGAEQVAEEKTVSAVRSAAIVVAEIAGVRPEPGAGHPVPLHSSRITADHA